MKKNYNMKSESISSWKVLAVTLCGAMVITLLPEVSMADASEPFKQTLCDIAKWFTGSTGKAIATIAIIFLGIAAFFGKVTWGLALMFAVGIFAIFGAAEIVNAVTQNKSSASC